MRQVMLKSIVSFMLIVVASFCPAAAEDCCVGITGDVNGDGYITIGDISILINVLIINQNWETIICLGEADANGSGLLDPTQDDITVGDVAVLTNALFVTGTLGDIPDCYTAGPWGNTDEGQPDSLIAETTQLSDGAEGPRVAVSLYMYNDNQTVISMSSGYNWDNPKARLDSAVVSDPLPAAFGSSIQLLGHIDLEWSNTNRRVQCSALTNSLGVGVPASSERTHLGTYYFTLTDWTDFDLFCFDADPYIARLFVDSAMAEYEPIWSPPACFQIISDTIASGDVDGNGTVDAVDLATLIDYLYNGQVSPSYPYEGDLTGDCILDHWDIKALECLLYDESANPEACDLIDIYPAPTCVAPVPVFYDVPPEPLGVADVIEETDGFRVENIGTSGDDGIRLHATEYEQANGMRMDLENVSLATPGASIMLSLSGYVDDGSKSAVRAGPSLQQIGMAGVTNVSGQIQITGNFNPIGDPNVEVRFFNRAIGLPTGIATVVGGGVIATGTAIVGDATVTHVAVLANNPPTFSFRFDRAVQFNLATNPVVQLVGDEIHLVAVNAIGSIVGLGPIDMTAEYIGWFGVRGIKQGACCLGFVGNANLDPTDAVTIGDISVMIDNLFITGRPLPCLEEADVNLSGYLTNPPLDQDDISISDISILIDHLFIDQPLLSVCP